MRQRNNSLFLYIHGNGSYNCTVLPFMTLFLSSFAGVIPMVTCDVADTCSSIKADARHSLFSVYVIIIVSLNAFLLCLSQVKATFSILVDRIRFRLLFTTSASLRGLVAEPKTKQQLLWQKYIDLQNKTIIFENLIPSLLLYHFVMLKGSLIINYILISYNLKIVIYDFYINRNIRIERSRKEIHKIKNGAFYDSFWIGLRVSLTRILSIALQIAFKCTWSRARVQ